MTDRAFAVLLARPESLDVPRIASVLSSFHGIPLPDAARRARACWGIVEEALDEGRARELAQGLDAAGLGGWALDRGAVADLPDLKAAQRASCSAGGLLAAAPGLSRVAPRAIRLIGAAAFEKTLVLDLVLEEPPVRLRIDSQNFDYSYLERRMQYDALGNFRLLIGDLRRMAPRALLSAGARVLAAGRPLREMGYESLTDLEREARWLLTIA